LDDALGRSFAAQRGLSYTGTLGVLIRARKEGLLPDLGAAIDDLRRTTMYLSPSLISAVLAEANES
jgi:predicted nucleic acid-binding protein